VTPSDFADRRQHRRARDPEVTAILAVALRESPCTVHDISGGGVKCVVARGLRPVRGERVRLTMNHSKTAQPLTLEAHVVRIEDFDAASEIIALRFVPLADPIHDTVLRIVRRALQRRREEARATVLVVDDEEQIRTTLVREMRRLARPCIVAETPSEAVYALQDDTNVISVVLVDLGLGQSDGLELVQYIASEHADIKRVVMSGQRFDDLARAVADGRAHQLLRKPWTKQTLHAALE
jgi:CheY-like chemotaxis protein